MNLWYIAIEPLIETIMQPFFHSLWRYLEARSATGMLIGIALGLAYLQFVRGLVYHLIMPVWGLFGTGQEWRVWRWEIGRLNLETGPFLAEFFVLLGVLWGVVWVMRQTKTDK